MMLFPLLDLSRRSNCDTAVFPDGHHEAIETDCFAYETSGMIAFTPPLLRRLFTVMVGILLLTTPRPALSDEPASGDDGLFVTVQNPITDATLTKITGRIDRAMSQPGRSIKKVVFDFNPDGSDAASDHRGSCRDFARYITTKLKNNGIRTIAFIHGKTTRHTVLPVLACDDLAMSSDAKIGEVVEPNEILSEDDAKEYVKAANSKFKEALVRKMLDKNIEVVCGREGQSTIYVDSANIDKDGTGKAGTPFQGVFVTPQNRNKPALPRGSVALYDRGQALQFNLCSKSVETRQDLAADLEMPSSSLHEDGGGGKYKAVKIELTGSIDESFHQKLKSQLKEVKSRRENLIFFVLECGGGSAKVAREIADEIRDLHNDDNDPVWTVAFIPNKAPDIAAFIAFACSEIVMFKGSEGAQASLGDFEQFLRSGPGVDGSNNLDFIRRNLGEIADAQGYPKLIVDALIDRNASILLVHNPKKGVHELMREADFKVEAKKDNQLRQDKVIKQPGAFLNLDAEMAKQLRIVQKTVDNRNVKEVYTLNGLTEKEVRDSKPGWLDDFAAFIRRTEISLVLVIIAFAGLILEFKMPGATVPGLVALVCFVLFFWAHAYENGQTVFLAIALFVLGLILLGVEIFILPGFGITGISGVLLILAGIGLATLEKAPSSPEEWGTFASRLVQYGLTLVAAGAMSLFLARYLPKLPYANRLMLVPPADNPSLDNEPPSLPGAEQAAALLGLVGTATSMLRPAGMAKIGDVYVDVVTEGDFIEPGTSIQVIEVEGTRIVVKRA